MLHVQQPAQLKAAALECDSIMRSDNASKKAEVTVDTTALSGAIASAEALKDKEEDYTAESHGIICRIKLTAAKECACSERITGMQWMQAAKALTDAIECT